MVLDSPAHNNCSSVAAGLVNPITGRKLTKTWLADAMFPFSKSFYRAVEQRSGDSFLHEKPIVRPAIDIQQINDAQSRMADGFLGDYCVYEQRNTSLDEQLNTSNGYFQINSGGFLDVVSFLNTTRERLVKANAYQCEWVDVDQVHYHAHHVRIGNLQAKHVIWCTGHYQHLQGGFSYLPFSPTRGEMLKFTTPSLERSRIYNKNFFIVPWATDYVSGATFSQNLEKTLTPEGYQDIELKIKGLVSSEVEITEHYYGIRPTVKDRKPFVGEHPELKNCFILNGLGAKGVTQGPYFANELVNFILEGKKLMPEVDVTRYHKEFK